MTGAMSAAHTSPLEGVRVVEFGHYLGAPLLGMLLADQGAEVVCIDRTGRARLPAHAEATLGRGKRRIELDLASSGGRAAVDGLIAGADVVIENFRPGVMERLGLGAGELCERHPHLVYCSLPGFGRDDPRAHVPGWEGVVTASAAGYVHPRDDPDGPPLYTAIPLASTFAALIAASSTVAALNDRARSGRGQHIEVPLHDAIFLALGNDAMHVHGTDRERPVNELIVGRHECADGRYLQLMANNSRFIRQWLEAAGVPEWFHEVRDFHRIEDPMVAAGLRGRVEELFRTRSAADWEQAINDAGTAASVCRTLDEWATSPQARSAGAVIEAPEGSAQPGRVVHVGGGADHDGDWQPRSPVAEPPGGNLDVPSTLGTVGWAPRAEVTASQPSKGATDGPLRDIRVLDLCIVLAGPTCGRTLAELGADVIKIDSPRRRPNRLHHEVNRGKRSLLLDLHTPEGIDIFWRLVDDADVVVQNFRTGVMERLGVGYEQVRERRPDIVYASINAYGHAGPWVERPGWEQVAQACGGLEERFGGDGPPVVQPYPVCDYGTGLSAAFGVVTALLQRAQTGESAHVRASLTQTATTLQALFLGATDPDEPRGQEARGTGALHRLYKAADGWLFLGAAERDRPRLDEVRGLEGIATIEDAVLEPELERRLPGATTEEWVNRLVAAGMGAQRALSLDEALHSSVARDRGLLLTREHMLATGPQLVDTVGTVTRLSRTPAAPGHPATQPGSDIRGVLEELGLADQREELIEAAAIVDPIV